MTLIILNTILIISYAAIVSYCDLKYKNIYNKLTFSFFIIGILVNCVTNGFSGLLFSITGTLTGLSILLIPFILGWVGGGDVKYLASLGSLLGSLLTVYSAVLGLMLSGAAAVVYLLVHRNLKNLLLDIAVTLKSFSLKGKNTLSTNYGKLPLGVFLSCGVCIVWVFVNFFK